MTQRYQSNLKFFGAEKDSARRIDHYRSSKKSNNIIVILIHNTFTSLTHAEAILLNCIFSFPSIVYLSDY
jgi:hypothetical protein